MSRLLTPLGLIVWKDLLLEFRTKEVVTSVLIFAILVVVVFNFALSATPQLARTVAPGVLWVSFSFAGVLAMGRAFVVEKDKGSLEGLFLCPVPRDAIYLGKVASIFLFMLVVEALLLPVFTALLGFEGISWTLIGSIVLATLGFAAAGTLFSAMAVNTRAREVMLPVLFFPIVVPVVIGAVEAARGAIAGDSVVRWLQLIAVFDAVFLVVCPWVFQYVLEE